MKTFGMNTLGSKSSLRMPLFFLGHGSPMNAMEDNSFTKAFGSLAQTFAKPKAILCISAHWYTRGTLVTAMEHPRTIYDFGGFPEELYEMSYPAPGDTHLAQKIRELLVPTVVGPDLNWGLDHGTWSVLAHMYPDADIPVVQLSIDQTLYPRDHFEIGRKLAKLRDEGILIIGSGNMVHNLSMLDFHRIGDDDYGYPWAGTIQDHMNGLIVQKNFDSLFNYTRLGSGWNLAIPTPEHFLPLYYILGCMYDDELVQIFNDRMVGGSLSMTSLRIG